MVSKKKLKPHHHIKITHENRLDLEVWRQFLNYPEVFARPFLDSTAVQADILDMYSDVAGNYSLGWGAYCGPHWSSGSWNSEFMEIHNPSIEFMELYVLTIGVLNWIHLFKNKRVILFCDNEVVVHMVNKTVYTCPHCMVLLRMIVLEGLVQNVRIQARYVNTKDNGKADVLSRCDYARFWQLAQGTMDTYPTKLPDRLSSLEKIWEAV